MHAPVVFNLLVWLLIHVQPTQAIDRVGVDLSFLRGDQWRLESPRGNILLTAGGLALDLSADALVVGGKTRLKGLALRCVEFEINTGYIVCLEGRASFQLAATNELHQTRFEFVYRRSDSHWRAAGELVLKQGSLHWSALRNATGVSVDIAASGLGAPLLLPWVESVYPEINSISGTLTEVAIELRVPFDGAPAGTFEFHGTDLGFDTEKGLVAAAGMTIGATGEWHGRDNGVSYHVSTTLNSGQLLVGSFYTETNGPPITLELRGHLVDTNLSVARFSFDDPDAATIGGSLKVNLQPDFTLEQANIHFEQLQFPGFYTDYLQAPLAEAGFGQLTTRGQVSGTLNIRDQQVSAVEFTIDRLGIEDAKQRFEVTGLGGHIRWQREGESFISDFGWLKAAVYRIDLGQAHFRFAAAGGEIELLEPAFLPILDGGLQIEAFKAEHLLQGESEFLFDARLIPISMGALTNVFGWPAMEGKIAGHIPEVMLEGGVYRLGGTLVLSVFGGAIEVANLRIERPFGVLPNLAADIEVDYLDLSRLTSVFTFGKIRGQLSGYVRNLRLLNWRPVHFDAVLRTPPGDDSEHRISQRAVDTLSSLGGGGPGAISSTFLRIFDDFGYEALGLSCELNDNICHMGGVAPAPNGGYYIVEGSGIPRVDVIGYVRWVDWPQLIEQLVASIQGKPPTMGEPDS